MQPSGAYLPTGPAPGHAKAHRFHAAIAGHGLIPPAKAWRNSGARGAGQTVATAMDRDGDIFINLDSVYNYRTSVQYGAEKMTTAERERLARLIDEAYAALDALQDEQVSTRTHARARTREGVMA